MAELSILFPILWVVVVVALVIHGVISTPNSEVSGG